MVEYNSFYGNRYTSCTETKERLKDVLRSAFLRAQGIEEANFYTPEIIGKKFTGPHDCVTGAFQVVVEKNFDAGSTPRWDVRLQHKEYPGGRAKPPRLVSERLIANSVTTRKAFNTALSVFSNVRWNSTGAYSHGEYRYGPDDPKDVKPVDTGRQENQAPFLAISWMPVFESVRLGTRRTLERRAMVLNRLNEEGHRLNLR